MKQILFVTTVILLISCSSQETRVTLREVDVTRKGQQETNVFSIPKTDDEIRKAYAEYLKYSSRSEKSRQDAIARLAELEFELGNKLNKEQDNLSKGDKEGQDEALYNSRLEKTIELLTTSLKEYPNSKKNDQILYNLANAYDQKGDHLESMTALRQLANKFPKSPYYIESQFRLAEDAFSRQDYVRAEDGYTEVITAKKNDRFYEKARFKRGWARFKQEYYIEAVDDFLQTVTYHEFDDYEQLNQSEKDIFQEYFRAIGLSFSYLGGVERLNEYLADKPDFKYLYYTYAHIGDIYEKQYRFSDAVETQNYFIRMHPNSPNVPIAQLKIFEIWKKGGFANRVYESLDKFYDVYNPSSKYWVEKNTDHKIYQAASQQLKDNILVVAKDHHAKFLKYHKKIFFVEASKWYERYLAHYASQARKDNLHYMYAELLSEGRSDHKALEQYELAAYDTDIILNKDAAYATITLTSRLYDNAKKADEKTSLLDKHIKYAMLFSQLYPTDKQSLSIISHAAELAFKSALYQKAIELAELIPDTAQSNATLRGNIIKAHSYFKLEQYKLAEANYQNALASASLGPQTRTELEDKLALSVYKQAEVESGKGNIDQALFHFSRIGKVSPDSKYAATGMYDAIALTMSKEMWTSSVYYIQQFQSLYPRHKMNSDVARKLSAVYLKSGQDLKAAKEFEKVADLENNAEVKTAALWKAAELYESKNDYPAAIHAYQNYVAKSPEPFPQYMEAMNKLVVLYSQQGDGGNSDKWRNNILKADKHASKKAKTERTKFIASTASLELAKEQYVEFDSQKLTLPLKTTLRKKKLAMQSAVLLFGRASVYGVADTATEATHTIAEIYSSFSKALLTSERPTNLKKDELEQYQILLEDKAFPFEEKAIEFFEANLAHIKDGVYNKWVQNSFKRLEELFPVRYKRDVKVDAYINVIQ